MVHLEEALVLARSARGAALAQLIGAVLDAPSIHSFSAFLALPEVLFPPSLHYSLPRIYVFLVSFLLCVCT